MGSVFSNMQFALNMTIVYVVIETNTSKSYVAIF